MVKSQKQIAREHTVCRHDSKVSFWLRSQISTAVLRVRTDRYDNMWLHPLTKNVTGA